MNRIFVLNLLRKAIRAIPAFRGKWRIVKLLKSLGAASPASIMIDDFDGSRKFNCDLTEHISSDIFWNGFHSSDQLWVLDGLGREATFIDIGANQGEFTIFAAGRLTHGKVFAVEPFDKVRGKLQSNLTINGFQNVEVIPYALSDAPGRAELFTDAARYGETNKNNCGLTSLVKSEIRGTKIGETEVSTLDELVSSKNLDRLDLIKIDVEGSEPAVLRGGLATLEKFKPMILIELNAETLEGAGSSVQEVVATLESLGYQGFMLNDRRDLQPLAGRPAPTFGNALFRQNEQER